MIATRALAALLLSVTLVGAGYQWGASATKDHIDAAALKVERKAAAAVSISNDHVQAREEKSASGLVDSSTAYQKGLSDGAALQAATTARIHSGALRLSVPARLPPSCAPGAPAAGAGGRDGEARAELSVEGADFLTGLLTEADRNTLQLTACQSDLKLDRETVNQEPVSK